MPPPRASRSARPRRVSAYSGQCTSAVTKKKLTPASNAAGTAAEAPTIPRQNGLTCKPAEPRGSRSVRSGKDERLRPPIKAATSPALVLCESNGGAFIAVLRKLPAWHRNLNRVADAALAGPTSASDEFALRVIVARRCNPLFQLLDAEALFRNAGMFGCLGCHGRCTVALRLHRSAPVPGVNGWVWNENSAST